MEKRKKRILFLANVPQEDKRSIGGATMLSKEILKFLNNQDEIQINHVQFRKNWKPKWQILDFLWLMVRFPFLLFRYDVISIHSTPDMNLTIGPYLAKMSKIFNRKVIYHFFGGNFKNQYDAAPLLLRKIIDKTIFRSDYVFFETHGLISAFANNLGPESELVWLPNARERLLQSNIDQSFSKRFVFISRIIKEKGVDLILEAFQKLDKSYHVTFYGPIADSQFDEGKLTTETSSYGGVLTSDEVKEILKCYDVLLLPTYFEGEGYPGIIIEALSVGLPVITSNWKAIGEVVEDGYNGLLCHPKDSNSLLEKIKIIDQKVYDRLSENAWNSFVKFDINQVFKKFVFCYLN